MNHATRIWIILDIEISTQKRKDPLVYLTTCLLAFKLIE